MDKSLLIFIAVVLLFTYRGYRNGLLKSVGRILGVAAAYLSAILFTGSFSEIVANHFALQGLAAFLAASMVLFIGTYLLVIVLFGFATRAFLPRDEVTAVSSMGGAGVGVLTGMLVAIIIVWAFAFIRDVMPSSETFEFVSREPAAIEKLANEVASGAVGTALEIGSAEPELKTLSTALFKAPGEVVQQAQKLSNNPNLQQLLTDPRNRMVLESGDPQAVSQLNDFRRFARDPDVQRFMQSVGLNEYAAETNQDLEQALASQLTSVWERTQRVKNDPRLHAILRDAEFQRQVQSGNPIDLLNNEKLLDLARIVFADESEAAAAMPPTGTTGRNTVSSGTTQKQPANKKKKIYTWTDENGKLHISDVKPDS